MNCIESITEGQQIVVDNAYKTSGRYSVGTVTKVSKTRVTVGVDGQSRQFNRRDGVEIGYGDNWSRRPRIAVSRNYNTPESLLSVEEAGQWEREISLEESKKQLARAIRGAGMDRFLALSLEELQAIADKIGVEK